MDSQFIQWLAGQTGVAGVASFALWMLKQSYEDRDWRQREMLEREKQVSDTLIQALQEHTRAVTENTAALAELQRIVSAIGRFVDEARMDARER